MIMLFTKRQAGTQHADGADAPAAPLIWCIFVVASPLTMHLTPPQRGAPALSMGVLMAWHTETCPIGPPLRLTKDPKFKRGQSALPELQLSVRVS